MIKLTAAPSPEKSGSRAGRRRTTRSAPSARPVARQTARARRGRRWRQRPQGGLSAIRRSPSNLSSRDRPNSRRAKSATARGCRSSPSREKRTGTMSRKADRQACALPAEIIADVEGRFIAAALDRIAVEQERRGRRHRSSCRRARASSRRSTTRKSAAGLSRRGVEHMGGQAGHGASSLVIRRPALGAPCILRLRRSFREPVRSSPWSRGLPAPCAPCRRP